MALVSNRRRTENLERLRRWEVTGVPVAKDPYARLAKLQATILGSGTVVMLGDPEYDSDRQLPHAHLPLDARPLAIVHAATIFDVREALAAARDIGCKVTVRSGGHSSAGYSVGNGMVLDLGKLSYVSVDADRERVRVGAGTPLGLVNFTLDAYDLHVPAGICADVAVGGHVQGGGYGFTSRAFGLNLDHVESVLVMRADGRLVVADRKTNDDLLWAMRGGTGNNFGVLLEVTYRTVPLEDVWGFAYTWPLDQAPEVLVAMQRGFMRTGPARLGYMPVLTAVTSGGGAPAETRDVLLFVGVYAGSETDGRHAIAPLLAVGSPHELAVTGMGRIHHLNDALLGMLPGPHGYEVKRSRYVDEPVDRATWQKVVAYFRYRKNPFNLVALEPYGGAINAVPASDCAFIHRAVDFNVFIDSFFDAPEKASAAIDWMNDGLAHFEPFGSGRAYQNYPFAGEHDYRRAYWGEAFARLLEVKRKYDPDDLFSFPQGIKP